MGASWEQRWVKWDPEDRGSAGRETSGRQACVGMATGDCWGARVMQMTWEKEETCRVIGKAPKPDFSCFAVFTRDLPKQIQGSQVGKKRPGCFQHYKQPWNVEHWQFRVSVMGILDHHIWGVPVHFLVENLCSVENWPGPLDFPLQSKTHRAAADYQKMIREETKPRALFEVYSR